MQSRVELLDEAIEEVKPIRGEDEPYFYYRFQRGRPVINARSPKGVGPRQKRQLERQTLLPDQSVLAQRKDPDLYPEITSVGQRFGAIQTFREWAFGRYAPLRHHNRPTFLNTLAARRPQSCVAP